MWFKKLLIFLSFLILSGNTARAAHLVGGEITTRCLGNNNYEITLQIYRDCFSTGAPFDAKAVISIYDINNVLVRNDSIALLKISSLPVVAPNNCTFLPRTVCTEKGLYKYTVNLPPKVGGYTITHQRCCRNNTITNINNTMSQWGSTYTATIPSMDTGCNSSPVFKDDPPVVLCLNVKLALDLGATDADGDSLHYELCEVLNGGFNGQGGIAPSPAAPPPYSAVPFLPGYSSQQPITSFPMFAINPVSGILTGTPSAVGQFVFAICVSEYRNGDFLGVTRRDFQFNVSNACQIIIARIEDQKEDPRNLCSGGIIRFKNKSQFATKYFWNFGDPTTLADTSWQAHPTYTYPDTGVYKVMLVAQPYSGCADTTYSYFEVYDSPQISFTYQGEFCYSNNSFDFFPQGDYSQNSTFVWDYGGNTNRGLTDTVKNPTNISWAKAGSYLVRVTVRDFQCVSTFADTVHVYSDPIFDEEVNLAEECMPYSVEFKDRSVAMTEIRHLWYFGDGNSSTQANPVHVYDNPGTYTVEHYAYTYDGCVDSSYTIYPDIITIYPVPQSGLIWQSKITDIYDPVFYVSNNSSGHTSTKTILPDGQRIDNMSEATVTMRDTGNFLVYHISYNEYNCVDTLIDTIRVDDPFTLYIPNAFSPNGDGMNDLFTFKMSGISSIVIEIYNRWGEIVYQSTDPKAGWDGTILNSEKKAPGGVYAYVLKARVKKGGYQEVRTGPITLLR